MKTDFELNTLLYQKLNSDTAFKTALGGGIYIKKRPLNSAAEDTVINTINITRTHSPQRARSVVNIYVPDANVNVGGVNQKMPNDTRMRTLAGLALTAIESAKVEGVSLYVSQMGNLAEPDINQHFVNLRVDWHIYN
jgi:hypothetical protein